MQWDCSKKDNEAFWEKINNTRLEDYFTGFDKPFDPEQLKPLNYMGQ